MIKLRKKQKGFTLVELLIVIAIIAVLAAVVTPVALSAINESRVTAVYAEVKSIETAQLTRYVQVGSYTEDFTELDLNGLTNGTDTDTSTSKNATYELALDDGVVTLHVTNFAADSTDLTTELASVSSSNDDFQVALTAKP